MVNQIWAEVKVLANAGEELFLPAELEKFAQDEQRKALEQDDREGLVREYLEMLLPEMWDEMELYKRREYLRDPEGSFTPTGVKKRTRVSNMEIRCECFGKYREDIQPKDSYAIASIMKRIEGWEREEERNSIPLYGQQRTYIRKQK